MLAAQCFFPKALIIAEVSARRHGSVFSIWKAAMPRPWVSAETTEVLFDEILPNTCPGTLSGIREEPAEIILL